MNLPQESTAKFHYREVDRLFRFVLGLLVAGVAIYVGAGGRMTPDSQQYLAAAESFPYYPSSYHRYPPLYPAFLALFGANATYLNAALIAVLTGTVGWIFRGVSLRVWIVSISVAAFARPMQLIYGLAWSEGLFVVLTLWFLIIWALYLGKRDTRLLWTASVLLTACVMTRHIGVALYAVCLVSLLRERQIRDFVIVCGVPLLTQVAWLVRNQVVSGYVEQRYIELKWVDVTSTLSDITQSLGNWVLPHIHGGPVLVFLTVAVVGLAVWGRVKATWGYFEDRLIKVCADYVVLYLLAIAAAILFSNIPSPGERFYAPVFIPLWVVAVFSVQRLYAGGQLFTRKTVEYFVLIWGFSWVTAPNALSELVLSLA